MRRRNKALALSGLGLALMAIPILMLAALILRRLDGGLDGTVRAQQEVPAATRWQMARNPEQGIAISYPDGWQMESGPPLVVRAERSEPVGLLVALDAPTPLPPELAEWLAVATEPIHVAHNVAVNDLSGTETVYLRPGATATRLLNETRLRSDDSQLMVVLWESSETPLRVYLVTTDQGAMLATLAQMRGTLRWER